MSTAISPRLAKIVAALPLKPHFRVLEIGCGTGIAARAVANQLDTGHILAIDRSAKAIDQLRAGSAAELASGRLSARQATAEDFTLEKGEEPFDLVFAIRVGALDGRHPKAGAAAMERIAAATVPGARLFIDGGRPLRELSISKCDALCRSTEPCAAHPEPAEAADGSVDWRANLDIDQQIAG